MYSLISPVDMVVAGEQASKIDNGTDAIDGAFGCGSRELSWICQVLRTKLVDEKIEFSNS